MTLLPTSSLKATIKTAAVVGTEARICLHTDDDGMLHVSAVGDRWSRTVPTPHRADLPGMMACRKTDLTKALAAVGTRCEVSVHDADIILTGAGRRYVVNAEEASDLTSPPSVIVRPATLTPTWVATGPDLHAAMVWVRRHVATDESRPILACVAVGPTPTPAPFKQGSWARASDSYTLGAAHVPYETVPELLLPAKAIVDGDPGIVRVYDEGTIVQVGHSTCRAIDAEHPNMSSVIPSPLTEPAWWVDLDTAWTIGALNRLAKAGNPNLTGIRLDPTLEAFIGSHGTEDWPAGTEVVGSGDVIALNPDLLRRCVEGYGGRVRVVTYGAMKPCVITADDTSDSLAVLMPVRVT